MVAAINARRDGAAARSLPITHEILTWTGDKPAHGVMAAARVARYRLLLDWCRQAGVLHLALGHHADDQAETVLMRRAHGSGRQGLAGMTAIRQIAGIRVLRPLLGCRKAELVAMVRRAGLSWIEDPSNAATRYERVRWRQQLGPDADILGLLQEAAAAGQQRDHQERQVAVFLARYARIDPAGYLTLDRGQLLATTDEVGRALLRQGLMLIGNRDYAPGPGRIARLLSMLRQQSVLRLTLGGCLVTSHRGVVSLFREAAACEGSRPLAGGQWLIWDGRFAVTLSSRAGATMADHGEPPFEIAAIGEYGLANRRLPTALAVLPQPARAAFPGLWQGGRLVGIARLGCRKAADDAAEDDPASSIHRLDVCFRPTQAATSCGFTVVLPPRHTM
jgi:tRNA(Ile)-lysidine synthase